MEFGKVKLNTTHVVIGVAVLVALGALYYYSEQKGAVVSGMVGQSSPGVEGVVTGSANQGNLGLAPQGGSPAAAGTYDNSCQGMGANFGPSNPAGQNSGPAGVSGMSGTQASQPKVNDPAELLPQDANSEWGRLNPTGQGDANNGNLLKAGYHIGRDTVLGSLRNANLQLRSEPANPQVSVGPWNTTTIGPDDNRRPLEIGCGPY